MNPFEFVNAISFTKEDVMVDDLVEKEYVSFMVNRQLSYFQDTVLLANEMNIAHNLDKKLQFDFLLHTIRKRKRFSKWHKVTQQEDVEAVKAYYGYSEEKAHQALGLLTDDQIKAIKAKLYRGGKTKPQ